MASVKIRTSTEYAHLLLEAVVADLEDYARKNRESISQETQAKDEYLHQYYKKIIKAPDYSSPYTQFAYVYKYFAIHAEFMCDALFQSGLKPILHKGPRTWKVALLGGGPGPEALGLAYFFAKAHETQHMEVTIFDKVLEWNQYFQVLCHNLPIHTSGTMQAFHGEGTWPPFNDIGKFDIITMSYFCSEMEHSGSQAAENLKQMTKVARPGAIIVIIDNQYHNTPNFIDGLMLESCELVEKLHKNRSFESKFILDGPLDNLNRFRSKYFAHDPLLSASPIYRIYQKQR